MLIDPFKKEIAPAGQYGQADDWKALQAKALELMKSISAINTATPDNKACPDAVTRRRTEPKTVMAVHRGTGDIRRFVLDESRPSALGLAETLFKGNWRIATLEEEQAELERRAAEKKSIDFRNEHELRAKELEIASRALQFVNAGQPAPIATKAK